MVLLGGWLEEIARVELLRFQLFLHDGTAAEPSWGATAVTLHSLAAYFGILYLVWQSLPPHCQGTIHHHIMERTQSS